MRGKVGLAAQQGLFSVTGLGLFAVLATGACGGAVSPAVNEGMDSGSEITRGEDSGAPADSGALDSSTLDAGRDAGSDTGNRDSSATDTGQADTGQAKDSSIGSDAGRVPINHRPDDSECMTPAPVGDCNNGGGPGGECSADNQCPMGQMGRCINDGPIPGCHCTYDSCTGDSACGAGEVCACHGSAYTGGAGNTCIPGDCRVDSDCGAHGFCSPTTSSMTCGNVTGYYCHTASDECVDDGDCGGPGFNICVWTAASSRWTCQMGGVCA